MPVPRFYSFWSINDRLDLSRLCRQLDELKRSGLDGVVFHPRYYPNDPDYLGDKYLAIVSATILYAKTIGMRFWLYDENGWPSGTVGGRLTREYPDDTQLWAGLTQERPDTVLFEFEHGGERWYLGENRGRGVDYLGTTLAPHFIELTYERYRLGLDPEAFDYVEAFFDDEPEFGLGHVFDELPSSGAIPWTASLPALYLDRYGEELLPLLPSVFFEDERSSDVRVAFWQLVTDLFRDNYISAMDAWCLRYGKRFAAHLKGEEHPLFQVPIVGSNSQVFARMSLPGIDALERFPGNDFYPRQVSTSARQWGDGRAMVEAWGGSGWGGTPEDLERYLLWLGRHGLTDFVMHLSQYRLDSPALDDWPPSQPLHLTWSRVYTHVIEKVRYELTQNPRPAADVLVVAPYRAIMRFYSPAELPCTNVHNASTHPDSPAAQVNRAFLARIAQLHDAGVNYDVVDERLIEETSRATRDAVILGAAGYHTVLPDPECLLSPTASELVAPFVGTWPSEPPRVVECEPLESATTAVIWSQVKHPVNSLVLEPTALGDGRFAASARLRGFESSQTLQLFFADAIDRLSVNGELVSSVTGTEGSTADIVAGNGTVDVEFAIAGLSTSPRLWARGVFSVVSVAEFTDGPAGTLATDGPFVIIPPSESVAGESVAGGYPFLSEALEVETEVDLPAGASIRFDGVLADALGVTVDGLWRGWAWGREGRYSLETPIEPGLHTVRIELIPNGFNHYGPHHYYGGDWHVVSPDQIAGRRNFADPADAPLQTHVDAWHFRPMRLPTALTVIP